ncbi:AmmeMemoRadiSam system radical SAM enzyme [Fusobacteria bacterium ZRK30]|nr:AmmeMemoRadiSam system radical SAM enzyme [Fusobacteria bacterium ZRK30]
MEEALFYKRLKEKKIGCELCPHRCIVEEGHVGRCGVRQNVRGTLMTKNYGIISALNIDPIEKKPFYHFYPGEEVLSIGSIGCNMNCAYCQNYEIAKEFKGIPTKEYTYEDILRNFKGFGVAFTYNEPTVWYEFMLDVAKLAKCCSKKTMMITNGFIEREPLLELTPYIDGFSVDLKGFTQEIYSKLGGTLEGVKDTLKVIVGRKKHLEIEFLLVPELNDDREAFLKMVKWIREELGSNIVLHINGYYPSYKLKTPATEKKLLLEFHEVAKKYLNYVYIGNAGIDLDTVCSCGNLLIRRNGWNIEIVGLSEDGRCKKCREKVVEIGGCYEKEGGVCKG